MLLKQSFLRSFNLSLTHLLCREQDLPGQIIHHHHIPVNQNNLPDAEPRQPHRDPGAEPARAQTQTCLPLDLALVPVLNANLPVKYAKINFLLRCFPLLRFLTGLHFE